jgi:hypothetical protein
MKHVLIALITLCFLTSAYARGGGHGGGHRSSGSPHSSKAATGAGAKSQREHVSGYTKKDGTRVAKHDRSTKDQSKSNNWSTKGNTNPETGKTGTK